MSEAKVGFKSGIVAATQKGTDKRWILKFNRKDPKDKPASFYVKLLLGNNPPAVGTTWKESNLKQLDDNGGLDWYEVLPEPMKSTTRADTKTPGADTDFIETPVPEVVHTKQDVIDKMTFSKGESTQIFLAAYTKHDDMDQAMAAARDMMAIIRTIQAE